jgi:hypothetical protein
MTRFNFSEWGGSLSMVPLIAPMSGGTINP